MASVRALRGATTLESDSPDQVAERTVSLLEALLAANAVAPDDLISVQFTAPPDITTGFPATAARTILPADVPMFSAAEMAVDGDLGLRHCIRVMVMVETELARSEVRHVYQHGAKVLRPDLAA